MGTHYKYSVPVTPLPQAQPFLTMSESSHTTGRSGRQDHLAIQMEVIKRCPSREEDIADLSITMRESEPQVNHDRANGAAQLGHDVAQLQSQPAELESQPKAISVRAMSPMQLLDYRYNRTW